MKNNLGVGFLLILAFTANAQEDVEKYALERVVDLDRGVTTNHVIIQGFDDREEGRLEGDYYIDAEWNTGSVTLKEGSELGPYLLRYDLLNQLIEFKVDDGIKVLKTHKASEMQWQDKEAGVVRKFVDGANLETDERQPVGMYEILVEGACSLLRQSEATVKKPDYVPAFNVGSRNAQVIRRNRFFVLKDNTLFAVGKNSRQNLNLFGDKAEEVERYRKANRLKYRLQEDLIEIVTYYNSLVAGGNG